MRSTVRPGIVGVPLAGLLAVLLAGPTSARAAVPFVDIASSGPLTHVYVGNELSCQIAHAGDAVFELYPSSGMPGDCGTLVAVGGMLYGPDFASHGSTATSSRLAGNTPFTPVSQTPVTGSGTAGGPFKVVTVVNLGASGLQITQTDTYVTGDESYRTDVTLANRTAGPASAIIYRAGDCYLQGTDTGYGFTSAGQAAVGCSANANNTPPARIEQWLPITPGNAFLEARFSDVWAAVAGQMPFGGTCLCAENADNGAGISWSVSVPAGGSVTRSHYTTFSPRGVTAPPPSAGPPAGSVPPAFGPNGAIQIPSARACLSRRSFRIHIRKFRGVTYEQAIVFVNGRRVGVIRGRQFSAGVDLRNLPAGIFAVQITVITTSGKIINGTRTYHTCAKRLPFLGPPRL